ncbi:retrotransposon protein, putative, ty1-copia subclass [Tanacetum coccineum]
MKDNQVWVLVDLSPNGQTVGSKWLFKKKTDMDGNVHTFKARLVAKGYTQTYGVDYGETFSPVANIRAIRILLAIAAFFDYEIWQMNVKPAFLNGHLSEDVYMMQPEGFVDPKHPNKNPDEPCVYLKASGSNVAFLILYVNDILLMGNNVTMLQEVKSWLCRCFSMKDLGEATYILGIKIIRDRSKQLIALSFHGTEVIKITISNKITKDNADTLCDIVEQARSSNPLDNALEYACMYAKQIQELLVYVSDTCSSSPNNSEKLVVVTSMNKNINKSIKSVKKKEWKPTSTVFTNVRHNWVPTGRTFTIVGNKCPLTRITSTKIVPPRKLVKSTVITKIQPSSVSKWRPKVTTAVRSSSEPRIVESRPSNNSEPNKNWGSTALKLHSLIVSNAGRTNRLVQNPSSSTPYVPPSKKVCDIMFQPLFDEYFQPPSSVVSHVLSTAAPLPTDTTDTPSLTTIDQDAPSASTSPITQETQAPVIHQGVEEQIQGN